MQGAATAMSLPRAAVRRGSNARAAIQRRRESFATRSPVAAAEAAASAASGDAAKPGVVTTVELSTACKTVDKSNIAFDKLHRFNMLQTFPGVPPLKPASELKRPETLVSTLSSNGLRVASQETYGQLCTFGVLIDAGSRYESDAETGTSHLLELMSFKSTRRRTQEEVVSEIEDMGGILTANVSREQSLLCVDVLRDNLEPAMDVLADCVLRPKLDPEEVEEQKEVIRLQLADMPADLLLKEALQGAAYPRQPLGRPHYCPEDKVAALSADSLARFRDRHFTAPRMVLAGAGVGHDEILRLGERFFSELPAGSGDDPAAAAAAAGAAGAAGGRSAGGGPIAAAGGAAAAAVAAHGAAAVAAAAAGRPAPAAGPLPTGGSAMPLYTGGEARVAGVPTEPLVRVAVAFETCGWLDEDAIVPVCVLQILLGGGDSFSAGGPGKGMYSRLYREVLNRYYWVEAAEAFTSIHNESGLLGIAGASQPEHAARLMRVFCEHFGRLLVNPVGAEELSRARNMLKCNLLTQLESRIVLFEDIGRQMLTYGGRQDPSEVCRRIDAVTAADIMAVARRALSGPPAIAAIGHDLSRVPDYKQVCGWFGTT